jgi:membrane-associated progesterone receptor component
MDLIGLQLLLFTGFFFIVLYKKLFPRPVLPEITLEELAKFDGTNGKVYVGAKDKVFDVSACEAYYPGGNYAVFAGKDATVALAKMSLNASDMNIVEKLDKKQEKTLNEWIVFYEKKKNYPIVGRLVKKAKYN